MRENYASPRVKINSTGISGRKGEKNKKVTSFSIFSFPFFFFPPYSTYEESTRGTIRFHSPKVGIFRVILFADNFRLKFLRDNRVHVDIGIDAHSIVRFATFSIREIAIRDTRPIPAIYELRRISRCKASTDSVTNRVCSGRGLKRKKNSISRIELGTVKTGFDKE